MSDRHSDVREIEDRILISELLDTYATAIDTKDWELLATVFTADAILDYRASGGPRTSFPEAVAWLKEALAPFSMTQHLVANKRMAVDGDAATSRCYFFNPLGRSDGRGLDLLFVGGSYDDRLRRTETGWRIVERVQQTAWFQGRLPNGVEIPT